MPAGLDGNRDSETSSTRESVLSQLAEALDSLRTDGVLRVGVDGVDGAGKSTFADELARVLHRRGCSVVRSTTDSFHNPRVVRWAKGKLSPDGFYRDSHDIGGLKALLLDPLRTQPPQPYIPAAFDEPSDTPLEVEPRPAEPGSVLVFDGLFLQRRELRSYWDYVIYLDGEARVRDGRVSQVSQSCPTGIMGSVELFKWCAILTRYVDGFRLYVDECDPRGRADVVVDNNDFVNPQIVSARSGPPPAFCAQQVL